eukprot:TRINITY_DN2323_c0_g1_i2.p1 TRINITY_DN2323_c0_g1~~TRINITY_DN2323_c0_g1_i2.p1  ORF type:complete len:581 (+),score=203.20 TRINITY_DN2323_c0_g1_i2:697-2439(+)
MRAKIKVDKESLNFITEQNFADAITKITKVMLNKLGISQGLIITDATACVGGNSLSFSNVAKVRAIEINKTRFEMLNFNSNVCGRKNIKTYNEDYTDIYKNLKQHAVFLDPCESILDDKESEENIEIKLGDFSLYQICKNIVDTSVETDTRIIIIKLPLNADISEFKKNAKCDKDPKEDIELETKSGKYIKQEGDEEKGITGIGTTINATGDVIADTPSIGNGSYSLLQCIFNKYQLIIIDCFSTFRHFIKRAHFLPRNNLPNYKLHIYFQDNFVPMGHIRKLESSKEKDSRIWNSNHYNNNNNNNNNNNINNIPLREKRNYMDERPSFSNNNKLPPRRRPRDLEPNRREIKKDFRGGMGDMRMRENPRENIRDRDMRDPPAHRETRDRDMRDRGDNMRDREPRDNPRENIRDREMRDPPPHREPRDRDIRDRSDNMRERKNIDNRDSRPMNREGKKRSPEKKMRGNDDDMRGGRERNNNNGNNNNKNDVNFRRGNNKSRNQNNNYFHDDQDIYAPHHKDNNNNSNSNNNNNRRGNNRFQNDNNSFNDRSPNNNNNDYLYNNDPPYSRNNDRYHPREQRW